MNTRTASPVRVVAGAWLREGRLLAAQRPPTKDLGGLFELPGGKVEPGESDADALQRELLEELGVRVSVGPLLGDAHLSHGPRHIHLLAFVVSASAEPVALEHSALVWVTALESASLAWAPADRALADLAFRTLERSPC